MSSPRRPVAWRLSGPPSRTSVCTKSRWNEARELITAVKKATSRNGWFGKRWFFAVTSATKGSSFPESCAFSGDDSCNPVVHLELRPSHEDMLPTSRGHPFLLLALLYTTFVMASNRTPPCRWESALGYKC